ncbi:MAG: hypothetical protein K2H23_09170 [Oscillospiraceae bacterium]|nr:hypothetical protein [Oscillospiraceae bacterium]
MEIDMRKFVYVIWAVTVVFPLIAAVIFSAVRRGSIGKFAKGFAAGFITYAGVFSIAAVFLQLVLSLILIMLIIPALSVILLAIPLVALLLVFAVVMIYYHALFKKIQNAADAISVSLGLFGISFLACIVCEWFKIHSISTTSEILDQMNYKVSLPNVALGAIVEAVIKTGLSAGAVAAVCGMYSSEKMTKRSAAKVSSAIMGILTVGFDMALFIV